MGAITEAVFSHAVALQQNGRLKNTIYAKGRDVFILNIDNTVLLKFELPAKEHPIKEIAFRADDYDSNIFHSENGVVTFEQANKGYVRSKTCSTPDLSFIKIMKIWTDHFHDKNSSSNKIQFTDEIIPLLEESLSHTEISIKDKKLSVVQKDIYSGSIITINKKSEGLISGFSDKIKFDFGPVGIRTNDFIALFSFCDVVDFYFDQTEDNYFFISGNKFGMKGIISACVYDELYEITKSKGGNNNGREIKEGRRSKQTTASAAGKKQKQINKSGQATRKRKRAKK